MTQWKRVSALLLGALLVAVSASAETAGERVAREAVVNDRIFTDTHEPWPERRAGFAGGVTGFADLTYATLPGYRPLKLDLYLPPQGSGPRPLIIYVHGGGWMGGGSRLSAAFANWPEVLASVAAEGFVVASVSYRFAGEEPFPAAIHDLKSAIRWLRANAGRFGIDRDRVAVWGASAGGQLAALAAVSCGVAALAPPPVRPRINPNVERPVAAPAGMEAESDCVQAAAIWYGVFDFATLNRPAAPDPNFREHRYLSCGAAPCSEERLRIPSPVNYIDRGDPPFLLIHGAADRTVPVGQSQQFHERLRAAGVEAELVVVPEVDHSFIGANHEATRTTSRQAIGRTLDFLAAALAQPRAGR
jgi:acetyl esterase/lipase